MTSGRFGDPAAAQRHQQQQQKAADDAWKKALAANAGGHTGKGGFTTDFENGGGLTGLRNMIMNADPEAIHQTSTRWTAIQEALHGTAGELGTHVNNLLQNWSGSSADAFRASAQDLHTSLTNGASYAGVTSGAMEQASFALSQAQAKMPSLPGNWDSFTRAATSESNDWQFKQDAASHGLQYAYEHDGAQLSEMEQRHQKAVLVMEQLGTSYNDAASQLVGPPNQGVSGGDQGWPPAPTTGPPVHQPGGSVPRSPGAGGVPGNGGNYGGTVKPIHGGVTPLSPEQLPPVTGTGVNGGIHGGGTGVPIVQPPNSSLDGTAGGPTTGIGGGGLGGGRYGGTGGFGPGGVGGGGHLHGGGFGGMAAGGLGGLGGGLGGGRLAGGGLRGEAGLASETAKAAESESAIAAREAKLAAGERGAGAGEGSGAGMGMGMGGAGRGANNKKKRKARAAYLVEDEETWGQDSTPNPPVIG